MQRLFSTFPDGIPGAGLLLIRICLGAALIYLASLALLNKPPQGPAQYLVEALAGIFLIVGLWTPLIGIVVTLNEVVIGLSTHYAVSGGCWAHLFLAVMAATVAMLGPGAWSIDAHLFGRKRFDIDHSRGSKPPSGSF